MLDVALCFEILVNIPNFRRRLEEAAKRPLDDVTISRLCILVFLHDIGKLNSGFQARGWDEAEHVQKAGHVAEAIEVFRIHELRKALAIEDMLAEWGPGVEPLFLALLAHHGKPINLNGIAPARRHWQPVGQYDPYSEAMKIGAFLKSTFPLAFQKGPDLPDAASFQHFFAGLTALADQVGSKSDLFPLDRDLSPNVVDQTRKRAKEAVAAISLDVTALQNNASDLSPAELFSWPPGSQPKPMQLACSQLPLDVPIAILESETGSGKTEAALLRFQRLFCEGKVDGLYFAVPTRSAATGLHRRIDDAARRLFGAEALLAVPGYLRIGTAEGKALPDWKVLWDDDPGANLQASRWAAETPRRYLAAPIAVGTVDQVMLSGFKTKWAHFRAATLSRAFLVIDEVHASDTYMTAVLSKLLGEHVNRGGHALLMSATLGAAARRSWLKTVKTDAAPDRDAPYPALSYVQENREVQHPAAADGGSKKVSMRYHRLLCEPERIADLAAHAVKEGGRVLVIRNTVNAALEVQRALETRLPKQNLLQVNSVVCPHHGRYALEDRKLLDKSIEDTFGKKAIHKPVAAVGTQTLEQSLDICADLLITDLCPVDVLLQRIGRLHRHAQRPKPHGFGTPVCHVVGPKRLWPSTSLLRFGLGASETGGVYQNLTGLEAVRRLIDQHPEWLIPADNRALVEAGTNPDTLEALATDLGKDWSAASEKLMGRKYAETTQANLNLLDSSKPFDGETEVFPEGEKISTRLGEDRIVLTLPGGTFGPFGSSVSQITVPDHFLMEGQWSEELRVEAMSDGLRLLLGETVLRYSRLGLEREDNA